MLFIYFPRLNNKLFQVKRFWGEWRPAFRKSRKEQVTITRLRIGHSRLTPSFILKQEQQPQCSTCQTPCTIKHVLLECKVFNDTTQIPWRTYLRTSTWIMFCRSWKRPGCTRKYRLGYNPENTTNQSTESKSLLNRNTIMFVLVEIVVRNNQKTKLSSLNKLMPYRNTWKYLLVCE